MNNDADGPFQANPLGRGQLADFLRCSLLTYRLRYARRYRQPGFGTLKISQLTACGMPPTYDIYENPPIRWPLAILN